MVGERYCNDSPNQNSFFLCCLYKTLLDALHFRTNQNLKHFDNYLDRMINLSRNLSVLFPLKRLYFGIKFPTNHSIIHLSLSMF